MILLFLLLSLAAVIIYVHFAGFVMWKTLLLFAGCFIALNVLFLLFWAVVAIFVSTAKPITKQSGICRLGCISVSSVMCGYAWVRTHIHGMDKLPTGERFLFVCNHRSIFDPLVVMSKLRDYNISFISKPSNMRIPIVGRVSYGAGFLPIDRENNRNALKTILTAADYLEKDICSVGIYPEGTRSKTPSLLPFHPGSFKIAQKAGVPLVIASISGSEKIKRNLFLRPTNVDLNILEVVPADKVKETSTNELADYSRGLIERSLPKAVKEAV